MTLMLDATRPIPVKHMRAGGATIRMLVELGRGCPADEDRRTEIEAAAAGWHAGFVRRTTGRKSVIVLTQRGDGPMPVKQTVWSLTFEDDGLRDAFYDWLCDRLHRWPEWAKLASKYGSDDLTHHLLMVFAASQFGAIDGDSGGKGETFAIEHRK